LETLRLAGASSWLRPVFVLWNCVNSQQQIWFHPWFWLCLFPGPGSIGWCLWLV